VAVVTLACLDLPQKIIDRLPAGLAIAGKLETENIGIDKLVKNVTANPHLRYLVIAGIDSVGHHSGQTLLALVENGVDPAGRVIGALGKRPVLKNVSPAEVEAFRRQIQVVDLIGCEDPERISDLIQELAGQTAEQTVDVVPCGCSGGT
jgi:tetrahydromethanopterin S-methyltransferase subunit A